MAILKTSTASIELPDKSAVIDAAKRLEVPFGCHEGRCGTCQVEVIAGAENLGPLTEAEQLAAEIGALEPGQRRMCQASIQNGEVTIRY